jgi:hypothetical protein
MMERHQHNDLWAEKLSQVSLPDTGVAWLAMEALLDKEMPTGRRRDRRRWLLLILLLLLLIGVCNCPGRGRFSAVTSRWRWPKAFQNVPASNKIAHGPSLSAGRTQSHAVGRTQSSPASKNPSTVVHLPSAAVNPPNTTASATPALGTSPTIPYAAARHPKVTNTSGSTRRSKPTNSSPSTGSPIAGSPAADSPATGLPATDSPGADSPGGSAPSKHTPVPASVPTAGPTVAATPKKKDSVTTSIRKPVVKDSTHKKPSAPPIEKPKEEKDHGWVVGIGLNQFFPIGGQRGSTYNSDGLTGTLSDYLPVPMIRYYFNRKTYVQLEAQLNTPQPTKKNLVFNAPLPDTVSLPGNTVVSSATIQQLYYFNIPLSFHYAPADNLNIGTGLQFSHLSNAIGNFDSTITNTGTAAVKNANDTKSFKGDTLYRRIKTNELRFLVDVNYTYKHFVLGVRYNLALSNFINIQLPTGGVSQARNSSLQLYLRYIFLDTRKKKAKAP